jgi:hypothetical protein
MDLYDMQKGVWYFFATMSKQILSNMLAQYGQRQGQLTRMKGSVTSGSGVNGAELLLGIR